MLIVVLLEEWSDEERKMIYALHWRFRVCGCLNYYLKLRSNTHEQPLSTVHNDELQSMGMTYGLPIRYL